MTPETPSIAYSAVGWAGLKSLTAANNRATPDARKKIGVKLLAWWAGARTPAG
jgi:hypothetical protein